MKNNPFKGMPNNIFFLATPTEHGTYNVHCKLPDGSFMTFPEEMELQEAAFHISDVQKQLGLPAESAVMSVNKEVLNRANVANRKFKKMIEEMDPRLIKKFK